MDERGVSRRELLRDSAAGGGLVLLGGAGAVARRRTPFARHGDFNHGVMSGRPSERGITLWTRLDGYRRPKRLHYEVARDPDFARVVRRGVVTASPKRDFTIHKRLRRLRPGREYWYRFYTRYTDGPVGRFRTLRPPDSREPVRVAFYSCQGWQAGYFTAHAALAEEDVDLVVCLGDYIYELTDDTGPRVDKIGPDGMGEAQTLAEYRQKYRLYRSDRDLQAMHAAHPHVAVWDSHDVESGGMEGSMTDINGRPRRIPYSQRLRAGMRAFFENMPQPRFRDRRRVYRTMTLGRHAELLLTDLQLYRDAYPCPFTIPPRPCPEASAAGRTYLGREQKRWLKARLEASPASWKLWGSTTFMMSLDALPGVPFNTGQWDGYVAERQELMEFLLARGIDDVAVFSGDLHTFFAGHVTTTGRSNGRRAATEFLGGAISSQGIPDTIAGEQNRELLSALTEQVRVLNPHIAYNDHRHRGYCVAEAGEDELRVDFRAVRSVQETMSDSFTLARFRVPRGEPRVERV